MVSAMLTRENNRGFLLVEALIGTSIISIIIVAVMLAFSGGLKLSNRNGLATRAGFLAGEGIEVARLIRDKGWDAYLGSWPDGTAYRLVFNGGTWSTTTSNTFIDGYFDRTVTAYNVFRDANNDIASSGSADPDTKRIVTTVGWRNGEATTTISIQAYLTNLFDD